MGKCAFFIFSSLLSLSPPNSPSLVIVITQLGDGIQILWRNVIFINVPVFKTPHLLICFLYLLNC